MSPSSSSTDTQPVVDPAQQPPEVASDRERPYVLGVLARFGGTEVLLMPGFAREVFERQGLPVPPALRAAAEPRKGER